MKWDLTGRNCSHCARFPQALCFIFSTLFADTWHGHTGWICKRTVEEILGWNVWNCSPREWRFLTLSGYVPTPPASATCYQPSVKKWKIRFFFLEKHLKMITNKSRFDITLLSVLPFYSNVTWPAPYGVVLNGIAVLLPLDMSKISPEYIFKTKLVHIPPTLLNFRTFLGNTRV